MPRKNWGMATPLTERTVPAVSTQVFGWRADMIPMGMATTRAKRIPRRQKLQRHGQSLGEKGHDMDAGADGNSKVATDQAPKST